MDAFNPTLPTQKSERKTDNFVKNLFALSPTEQEDLKKRIIENNGIARIMVHPYFSAQNPNGMFSKGSIWSKDNPTKQRTDIVENGFEKILETKATTPVFLFESYTDVKETKKRILPILKKNNNFIYIVETLQGNPTPHLRHTLETEKWESLRELMKKLGIKKVIIGGMYLFADNSSGNKKEAEHNAGCVGLTERMLKDTFEIQISSLVHPSSRSDTLIPINNTYKK